MSDDKKKKVNVKIVSDGTPEGTSLVINGVDITKTQNVIDVSFGTRNYSDGIFVNWSSISKDASGAQKIETYNISPYSSNSTTKVVGSPDERKLGDKAEIQFETTADKTAHSLSGKLKQLKDVLEFKDTEETK